MARAIDDFATYLTSVISGVSLYHPVTNPTGNLQTDSFDPSRSGTQIILFQGDPVGETPTLTGVQHTNIEIEIFGAEPAAHDFAHAIFDHIGQGIGGVYQSNYIFMRIKNENAAPIPRGQIKPGIEDYGLVISAYIREA